MVRSGLKFLVAIMLYFRGQCIGHVFAACWLHLFLLAVVDGSFECWLANWSME